MYLKENFLFKENSKDIRREDSGFKSKCTPLQYKPMEAFVKEFLYMIPNTKFWSVKDTFQKKLKKDIANIKQLPNFFVSQTKQVIFMKCLNNTVITFSWQRHKNR